MKILFLLLFEKQNRFYTRWKNKTIQKNFQKFIQLKIEKRKAKQLSH